MVAVGGIEVDPLRRTQAGHGELREVGLRGHHVHGCVGVVVHVAPSFTYPDANAHGLPHRREPTYHVEFTAKELWGEEGLEGESVVVDLWESYLEPIG